jgi:hypothetical protein
MKFKAKIIDVNEEGVSITGYGTVDSNPDRSDFKIEPINCTIKEFITALDDADAKCDFCIYAGDEGRLADMGYYPPIKTGDVLCISNGRIHKENMESELTSN